jgi:hypothetical protein
MTLIQIGAVIAIILVLIFLFQVQRTPGEQMKPWVIAGIVGAGAFTAYYAIYRKERIPDLIPIRTESVESVESLDESGVVECSNDETFIGFEDVVDVPQERHITFRVDGRPAYLCTDLKEILDQVDTSTSVTVNDQRKVAKITLGGAGDRYVYYDDARALLTEHYRFVIDNPETVSVADKSAFTKEGLAGPAEEVRIYTIRPDVNSKTHPQFPTA